MIVPPARVLALNGYTMSKITGATLHPAANIANGKLLVWGRLGDNQLGLDPDSPPSADVIEDSFDHRLLGSTAYLDLVNRVAHHENRDGKNSCRGL